MTALATPAVGAPHGAFRWALCFAAVVAAHGGVAMALLRETPADSGFNAGAPVVMIELPEAPAALSNPPTDLAPGPPEPESERTPPPKEETKPPEEMAEVTLPEPEPPKPEPPAEEKPPTALPSTVAVATSAPPAAGAEVEFSTAVRRWESALVAHIERFKRYPAEARARGARGYAKVAFTIDRDGRVLDSRIVQSTGSPDLDRESLAMLTRAQPMPKPPGQVQTADLSFVVPIRFNFK
jgi:periplasmic protein TonB